MILFGVFVMLSLAFFFTQAASQHFVNSEFVTLNEKPQSALILKTLLIKKSSPATLLFWMMEPSYKCCFQDWIFRAGHTLTYWQPGRVLRICLCEFLGTSDVLCQTHWKPPGGCRSVFKARISWVNKLAPNTATWAHSSVFWELVPRSLHSTAAFPCKRFRTSLFPRRSPLNCVLEVPFAKLPRPIACT